MKHIVAIVTSKIALVILILGSCVTPRPEAPPQWMTGVESEHPDGVQFITYGRSASRSAARDAANEDAVHRLEQIMVTELEKRAFMIDNDVARQVEKIAVQRIDTIERLDEFRRVDATDSYEMFLLLLYKNSQLTEDIESIQEQFLPPGADEAIGVQPDGKPGIGVADRPRSVLSQEVPLDDDARRDLLRQAEAAAAEVAITAVPGEATRPLGEPSVHVVTVTLRDLQANNPLGEESVTARIRGPLVDGQRTEIDQEVVTDSAGIAQIVVPSPQFAGTTTIEVVPSWFYSEYSRWDEALTDPLERNMLETVYGSLRARSILRVTSRAAEIPTAVALIDRDIAGNPITGADAMAGVLQELNDRGFRVRRVTLSPGDRERLSSITDVNVADLYDIFPFDVLSSVDRAIVGEARIVSFDEDEGYNVVVETSAVTFDLRRDQRFTRVTVTERISGSSAQATIRAAFQESGRRLARRLAPQLP